MKALEVINALEDFAPLTYQESYDNSGLQVGNAQVELTGVLISLDITEAIVDEAMERGCNMIIAHHPLLFSGLKSITGRTYIERIVQKVIKNDIVIYAIHTNLDNMAQGVNQMIANKLGLTNTTILAPLAGTLRKLYTYAPAEAAETVREALFTAGAGHVGLYSECSFNTVGTGTFKPGINADPTIGKPGGERELVNEVKIEVLIRKDTEKRIIKALFDHHPYEEVAYDIVSLQNTNQDIGAGMIGVLPMPMSEDAFLTHIKNNLKTNCIRYTQLKGKPVEKVAICGGSGSFLLKDAIAQGADFFVTADFKYHQFFDAEGKIVISDIGHYESEQFTIQLIQEILKKKIRNFATLLSNLSTNPVKYFC